MADKRTPLITIIGIPNSGKSTLFNRMIGQRKALIHSIPGMTRDIFKRTFDFNDNIYEIQDTGGFFSDDDIITKEINKRIFRAAKESDLIIFLFDGRKELLGYEEDLYFEIKKLGKPLLPIMNKVENEEKYILPDSYYKISSSFIYISAEHNINIEKLYDAIEKNIPFKTKKPEDNINEYAKVSFIGKPNVGKSSIINRLLNDDLVIVSPIAGTTRDSVDLKIKIKGKTIILVDNAGIRKLQKVKEDTETAAVIRAERDIKNANIIIFVIDISSKIDKNDLFIAKKIIASAKPVIIACNKWDLIENKNKDFVKIIRKRFNFFDFAPVTMVSAKTGKGIFELLTSADTINNSTNISITSNELIKSIKKILEKKRLITINNSTFNPKYAVIESHTPFFIRFHTKTGERLKNSDEVYLKRRLTEELELSGLPIFFKIVANKKK